MDASQLRYLELLSKSFPTASQAAAEIIRLNAALNLPKGPEFFASDIHGEYEAFSHIMRNASGDIRQKIALVFGDSLTNQEKSELATLIYYPREKAKLETEKAEDARDWYLSMLPKLIAISSQYARRYTQIKVRKSLPQDYSDIIEELMVLDPENPEKKPFYEAIVDSAIETGTIDALVEAICKLIQRLAVDKLHVVGDVYDRGPYPHIIMDELMQHHSIDIQWGNHDIVWMGAALGQRGCIAHVVRNCARYGNLSILEEAYGINLRPLASFALEAYKDDPCVAFNLKGNPGLSPQELEVNIKIQKAMAILQFKVEAALIDEYPCFELEDRKLLHQINHEKGTIFVDGIEYELTDKVFPTVDLNDPYKLTGEEEQVMRSLEQAFMECEKLQRHISFFLEVGSLYKISNGNLMFHACVPLNEDGSLKEADVFGTKYKGRALYDVMQKYVQAAFFDDDPVMQKRGKDLLWYMWLGQGSPLFAKSKMATFELYLIAEKAARKEVKNAYYSLINDEAVLAGIFEDFGLDPKTSHIICGHTPVKVKDGDDPVKCDGRAFIIDGGFSRAYQPTTGIAGLTLISNSDGLVLDSHDPLESAQKAIEENLDLFSARRVIEQADSNVLVADTDEGKLMSAKVEDLKKLLDAYRSGLILEAK